MSLLGTLVKLVPVFFHLNLISSVKGETRGWGWNGLGWGCLEVEAGDFSAILLNYRGLQIDKKHIFYIALVGHNLNIQTTSESPSIIHELLKQHPHCLSEGTKHYFLETFTRGSPLAVKSTSLGVRLTLGTQLCYFPADWLWANGFTF